MEEIAQNKAGIIKPGCAVVSAKQKENVREILKKTAEEKGCPFTEAQPEQMMIFEDSYHGITFSYNPKNNVLPSLSALMLRLHYALHLRKITGTLTGR